MPLSTSQRLEQLSVPTPLAIELGKQLDTGVYNVYRLIEMGMDSGLAKIVVTQPFDKVRAVRLGMVPDVSTLIARLGTWRLAARQILVRMASPIEGVMSSPPTITVGAAGANSTVVTGRTPSAPSILPGNAALTTISGTIFNNSNNWGGGYVTFNAAGTQFVGTNGWGQRFKAPQAVMDVSLRDLANTAFNVRVTDAANPRGRFISATNITLPTSTGSNFYYGKLDFGTVDPDRVVEFFFSGGTQIRGYNVGDGSATPGAVILNAEADPFLLTTGLDSYSAGVGPVGVRDGYTYKLANKLGVRSPVGSGRGSTGYIADASGAALKWRDRLSDLTRVNTPQMLIVMGSLNDNGQNVAALQAEVTAFWIAVRDLLPDALLVCIGPQHTPNVNPSQAYDDAVADGFAAANNSPRMKYFQKAEYWDQANAAKYADGTHWNDAGTDAFVAAFLPDLTGWLSSISV